MQTISLCMIVKNEEKTLGRCLSGIKDAVDEIIVVDTGSTDRTKEIAAEYGASIYDFPWQDDFSLARNFAFSKATMDYQMWLDADDVLPDAQREKFVQFKSAMDGSADVVMMRYAISFDAAGNETFSYFRERLLRRDKDFRWEGAVHEVITPRGKIVHSDVTIQHRKDEKERDSDRNLNIYRALLARGHVLSPRERFYFASELYFHRKYDEAIEQLERFLDEGRGWIENNVTACRYLSKCYHGLSRPSEALRALFRSFEWDRPRAEVLCDIGAQFFEAGKYEMAVHWYKQALDCPFQTKRGGFDEMDSYDFIPLLQLCVCYDRMGLYKEAADANERALRIKPHSEAALSNRAYFMAKE